jgi:hypothetical protein
MTATGQLLFEKTAQLRRVVNRAFPPGREIRR